MFNTAHIKEAQPSSGSYYIYLITSYHHVVSFRSMNEWTVIYTPSLLHSLHQNASVHQPVCVCVPNLGRIFTKWELNTVYIVMVGAAPPHPRPRGGFIVWFKWIRCDFCQLALGESDVHEAARLKWRCWGLVQPSAAALWWRWARSYSNILQKGLTFTCFCILLFLFVFLFPLGLS